MPIELKQPLIATTASQTRKIDKSNARGGYANVI
jgi:hypothetical protein